MRKKFEEIKTAKDRKIFDQKRMAQLIVAIHKSSHNLTIEQEQEELEELTDLLRTPHIYEAAEKLQLPLPDIKNISERDVAELLRWKESKIKEPDYDRYKIIEDVALKYREMQNARENSAVSTQVDSITSISSQESQTISFDKYIEILGGQQEVPETTTRKRAPEAEADHDKNPKILRRTDSYSR